MGRKIWSKVHTGVNFFLDFCLPVIICVFIGSYNPKNGFKSVKNNVVLTKSQKY